jgi:hypothetical protein
VAVVLKRDMSVDLLGGQNKDITKRVIETIIEGSITTDGENWYLNCGKLDSSDLSKRGFTVGDNVKVTLKIVKDK